MKIAGVSELKQELQHLSQKELIQLCLSLAKYKKDNKDYLGYLLFESHRKDDFVKEVKNEMDGYFEELKTQTNLYYAKKTLRKILRIVVRYCRFLQDDAKAAELHIYFCTSLKESGLPYHKSQLLINLMNQQLKRIQSLIAKLHPDLQSDFSAELEQITS